MRSPLVASCAAAAAVAAALAAASCCKDPPPAPPPAPVRSLIPPLQGAKVDQWIRVQAGVDAEVYRVVNATDYEVQVEVTRYKNDEPSPPVTQTWHRNSFGLPPNCVVRRIDPDSIEVGGVRYDCWRLSIFSHDPGVGERLYWVSEQIPVHGLLKAAIVQKGGPDEIHAATLVDWGPK
jgi:hypothetical protein